MAVVMCTRDVCVHVCVLCFGASNVATTPSAGSKKVTRHCKMALGAVCFV